MLNLSNICICESPFVMSRTDAQNGLYSLFKPNILTIGNKQVGHSSRTSEVCVLMYVTLRDRFTGSRLHFRASKVLAVSPPLWE